MIANRYQEMEILTASPEGLVAKLYEGALRHCRAAARHDAEGRIAERGRAIAKALAIVRELQNSLDHERGGEISRNLDALYLFVSDRLLEAGLAGGSSALEEAGSVLGELHGAWQQVARSGGETEAK